MKAASDERIGEALTAYVRHPEYARLLERERARTDPGEVILALVSFAFRAGVRWREQEEER